MDEKEKQLSFDHLLGNAQGLESIALKAQAVVQKSSKPKQKRPSLSQQPKYEVRLVHEDGVDWKLECRQCSSEQLDKAYYDHLASEALKLELLRLLKQDSPDKQTVFIITLTLQNLGVDVPSYLCVDANKNLFEFDFWTDFERVGIRHYSHVSVSYLWAFYFKDFGAHQCVVARKFTDYPAEETDITFLIDHELLTSKYSGLDNFS